MGDREFDIIVYGASGFVGGLTARYLAETAPLAARIALAGRDRAKIERVQQALPAAAHNWPILIADSGAPSTLDAMVARTRVVCTTVGPYLRYGESLLAAAATAGTDYVDLTGEVPFVRLSIDKYHSVAHESGARIVHSCGFDSVPSDLGAYLLHCYVADVAGPGETLGATTMVVKSMRGGLSGGTIDSMRVIADEARDLQMRRLLLNPHALSAGPGEVVKAARGSEPSDISLVDAAKVDPSLSGTLAPFFMASYNTRVVRRTNALLDNAYGPDFHYREAMAVGGFPVVSAVAAGAVSAGLGAFFGGLTFAPTRAVLDRILPKPGQGPSQKARDKGYFKLQTYTMSTSGRRFRAEVSATGDPGYKATAVMLGQSAMTLAFDRVGLSDRTGVLTPAAAMGDSLIPRLRDAGFVLDVTELC